MCVFVYPSLQTGPDGLDYDNDEFAGMEFRHSLQIEVSDAGTPSLTSKSVIIIFAPF